MQPTGLPAVARAVPEEVLRFIGADEFAVFVVVVSRKNPAWVPGAPGSPTVEATDEFQSFQDALRHLEASKLDGNVNWSRMMFRAGWTVQEYQNPDRLAEFEQIGSRRG